MKPSPPTSQGKLKLPARGPSGSLHRCWNVTAHRPSPSSSYPVTLQDLSPRLPGASVGVLWAPRSADSSSLPSTLCPWVEALKLFKSLPRKSLSASLLPFPRARGLGTPSSPPSAASSCPRPVPGRAQESALRKINSLIPAFAYFLGVNTPVADVHPSNQHRGVHLL